MRCCIMLRRTHLRELARVRRQMPRAVRLVVSQGEDGAWGWEALAAGAPPVAPVSGWPTPQEAERAARSLFHAPEPTQFRPYRGP